MSPLPTVVVALVALVAVVGGGTSVYIGWAHARRDACTFCDHVAVSKVLSSAETAAQAITLVLAVGGVLRELWRAGIRGCVRAAESLKRRTKSSCQCGNCQWNRANCCADVDHCEVIECIARRKPCLISTVASPLGATAYRSSAAPVPKAQSRRRRERVRLVALFLLGILIGALAVLRLRGAL